MAKKLSIVLNAMGQESNLWDFTPATAKNAQNRKERLCCLRRDRHCSSIATIKLIHYRHAPPHGPNGGVSDRLDEAMAAFRAAWERPLSSGKSGRDMLSLNLSVHDPFLP
jgi:hypothetical protein